MSDLISREALLKELADNINQSKDKPLTDNWLVPSDGVLSATMSVLYAPTIDAVEVVRCSQCQYLTYGYCKESKMEHSGCCENDYCSYGKRKDGAI